MEASFFDQVERLSLLHFCGHGAVALVRNRLALRILVGHSIAFLLSSVILPLHLGSHIVGGSRQSCRIASVGKKCMQAIWLCN
jgi:hypothetical protein